MGPGGWGVPGLARGSVRRAGHDCGRTLSLVPPFNEPGLPRAERLVDAPVEVVFGVLDEIPLWPVWMRGLTGPAVTVTSDTVVLSSRRFLRQIERTVRITGRGPTYTLFLDVDDGAVNVYFRTRPKGAGTLAEVVVKLGDGGRRRRHKPCLLRRARRRLPMVLEDLAATAERKTEQQRPPTHDPG
jgi:hypothetical protein